MHAGPAMPWARQVSATGEKLERARRTMLPPLGNSLHFSLCMIKHSERFISLNTPCDHINFKCTVVRSGHLNSVLITGQAYCIKYIVIMSHKITRTNVEGRYFFWCSTHLTDPNHSCPKCDVTQYEKPYDVFSINSYVCCLSLVLDKDNSNLFQS